MVVQWVQIVKTNRNPVTDRPGANRVTERLVVPWKPGNAGGGKEP